MTRSIELNETLEKGLALYTQDRIGADNPVTDKDLQDSFELIISKSLESVIEEQYRRAGKEKSLEEKAASIQ